MGCALFIQLFRERLLEKVHATIPKGIVDKNGTRGHSCMFASVRFDSYSVRNIVLIISHITFRDSRVHVFSHNLSRNNCLPDVAAVV